MGPEEIEFFKDCLIKDWGNGDIEAIVASDLDYKQVLESEGKTIIYLPKPYMGLTAYVEVIDPELLLSDDDDTHHVVCALFPLLHGYGMSVESASKALVRGISRHHNEFLRTYPVRTDLKIDCYRDVLDNVVKLFPDRSPTLRKKRAPNRMKEE